MHASWLIRGRGARRGTLVALERNSRYRRDTDGRMETRTGAATEVGRVRRRFRSGAVQAALRDQQKILSDPQRWFERVGVTNEARLHFRSVLACSTARALLRPSFLSELAPWPSQTCPWPAAASGRATRSRTRPSRWESADCQRTSHKRSPPTSSIAYTSSSKSVRVVLRV